MAGDASVVVTVMALQQAKQRLGSVFAAMAADPISSFLQPSGLAGPGHLMSVLARRHMHLYGTTGRRSPRSRISTGANAATGPKAHAPRAADAASEYFNARMIAEPLCLYDFCQETEGAVAVDHHQLDRART